MALASRHGQVMHFQLHNSILWNASRNFLSLVFWLAASATDIASLSDSEHGTARSVALSSFAHVPWTQDMTIWFHWYPWYTINIFTDIMDITCIRARGSWQLGQLSTNLRFTLQLSSTTKCLTGVGCCSPVQSLCQLETSVGIVFFMHFIIFMTRMPAILVPRQTPSAQRKLWRTQAPA